MTTRLTRRGFLGSMAAGAFSLGAFSSRSYAAAPDGVVPVPDIPNPDYLKPITDPTFGSKITRVTDPNRPVPGLHLTWGDVARHHYSIDPVWNADQSLMILDRGTKPRVFLNGSTYQPAFQLTAPGEVRWHPTAPTLMAYVASSEVGIWDVKSNRRQRATGLSGYSNFQFGGHKGNLSDDGSLIALVARRKDGVQVVFGYNLITNQKFPDIQHKDDAGKGTTTISPSGKYIFTVNDTYTVGGQKLQSWIEYERPGHADFAIDENGDDVRVGRSKSRPEQWQIIKRRLKDGHVTVLSPPCFAIHVSARNLKKSGWVFPTYSVRSNRSNFDPYYSEITALSLDGSHKVHRLAHTHAVPNGYLTEPHACPSPDGRRVIFASNWGLKEGPIAAYVAEFPKSVTL